MAKTKKPDSEWMSVVEAAVLLKVKYHKARDLTLSGHLGDVKRNEQGRYFVKRTSVIKYRDARQQLISTADEKTA